MSTSAAILKFCFVLAFGSSRQGRVDEKPFENNLQGAVTVGPGGAIPFPDNNRIDALEGNHPWNTDA